MSRYRCAIMEVETKFKVLNEQFSLQHERNPIENIKTRKFWANLEHRLCYKKDLPEALQQATAEELFRCAELSAQLDQRMQQVRYTVEK